MFNPHKNTVRDTLGNYSSERSINLLTVIQRVGCITGVLIWTLLTPETFLLTTMICLANRSSLPHNPHLLFPPQEAQERLGS